MAIIRNFDNRTECPDAHTLRNALQLHHGQSISIEYTKPSGIDSTLMVDVDENGNVSKSYGDQSALTFEEICSTVFPVQPSSSETFSPSWDDFESDDDLQLGEPLAVPKACSIDDSQCESCT